MLRQHGSIKMDGWTRLAVDTVEERMFYDILLVKKLSFHLIDEMNKS